MIYTFVQKLNSLSPHSTMNFLSIGIPKGTLAPAATSFKRQYVMLILLCLWHSQRNIPEFLCINKKIIVLLLKKALLRCSSLHH